MAVRAEIDFTKEIDSRFGDRQVLLLSRMRRVVRDQHALRERVPDAPLALRQSLVDLAAVAEALAGELPDVDGI